MKIIAGPGVQNIFRKANAVLPTLLLTQLPNEGVYRSAYPPLMSVFEKKI